MPAGAGWARGALLVIALAGISSCDRSPAAPSRVVRALSGQTMGNLLRSVVLLVSVTLSAACNGGAPASPTPTPSRQPVTFQLTGVVTDDDGNPMSGAKVNIGFVALDGSSGHVPGVTNELGVYAVDFRALPGARGFVFSGPAITQDTAALAWVQAPGCIGPLDDPLPGCAYDPDTRFISSATPQVTQNFRLHRISHVKAGESTTLTIVPADRVCGFETLDLICRTLRIVVPIDGTMKVEAVRAQGASATARLYLLAVGLGTETTGNPTSIAVTAGTEVMVNVGVPWGASTSQTFVVNSSVTAR